MLPIRFEDISSEDVLRLVEDKISERKVLEYNRLSTSAVRTNGLSSWQIFHLSPMHLAVTSCSESLRNAMRADERLASPKKSPLWRL